MDECPFCARITADQFAPLTADSHVVTFAPLNPVVPGHILVVSRTHIINAAADPITAGMAMQKAANLARGLGSCNIITSIGAEATQTATQTVPHLHIHVVPRRMGDGLALPWTTEQVDPTLYEQLAAIEHARWAHWQSYMHSKCAPQPDGGLLIPAELVTHWQRMIDTPYDQLTEQEKASDREQVDRYWGLIQ